MTPFGRERGLNSRRGVIKTVEALRRDSGLKSGIPKKFSVPTRAQTFSFCFACMGG
jgi:hypothetical protein